MSHVSKGDDSKAHNNNMSDKNINVQNRNINEHHDSDTKTYVNTVPTLINAASLSNCLLCVRVNEVDASCLVDTGAAVSLISKSLWEKLGTRPLLSKPERKIVGVQGARTSEAAWSMHS